MRTLAISLFVLLTPALARAQVRPVVHQRAVGMLNPMGVEHAVAVGARARLGDPDELLFTGAHAEAGAVNYTSPIYSMTGGYLEVSPLAFLVLRAQLTGVYVWPIGMGGAGYYGSDNDARPSLEGPLGETASGYSFLGTAILQGAVPLGPLRAILWNEASFEHLRLGSRDYHYFARYDTVLARQDEIVGNHGMLLLEIPLGEGLGLRVGAYDDLRVVPRTGWLSNQLGGVVMLSSERPIPEVGSLLPFVRVGVYTHHEQRAGEPTVLLGLMARYELTP